MKKRMLYVVAALLLGMGCTQRGPYVDGTWNAEVSADYEGYASQAQVRVKDGRIAEVNWVIHDTVRNRDFDGTYGEVFPEALYKQQSLDDWKGAQAYPKALVQVQELEKVDSLSGATWAYGKFHEVVGMALAKAVP